LGFTPGYIWSKTHINVYDQNKQKYQSFLFSVR